MLRTAAEAYKVMQLNRQNLPALAAFDLITRANAAALGLDGEIGALSRAPMRTSSPSTLAPRPPSRIAWKCRAASRTSCSSS